MRLILLMILLITLIGCSPLMTKVKQDSVNTDSRAGEKKAVQETLSYESKGLRLTNLDTLNRGKEISLLRSDFQSISPSSTTLQPAQSSDVSFRFRIQVFASSQIDVLRQEKKTLESKIDIPVFIAFESPYYKLYAGDFTIRSEAENYLPRMKKMGYNDSWIVRTKSLSQ
jgi:hypothetical protein